MTEQRLRGWRMAAFCLPAMPMSAMLLPITLYLMNFYTEDLGVNLAAVGIAFMLVRLFDLFFDPIAGFAIDKTWTRWGRFRPWIVAGAPLAMLAVYQLFMPGPGIDGVYIVFWVFVAYSGQSMVQLAHMAWAAQVAPAYDERSKLFGWWQALSVVGILTVLTLPVVVMKGFGGDMAAAIAAVGWFVIIALPVGLALMMMATGEDKPKPTPEPPRLGHLWQMTKRPGVMRLLFVDILINTGPTLAGSLAFFYFKALKGYDRSDTMAMLLLYFLAAGLGAPLWTKVARRIGKHRALMIAALCYIVAQSSVLWTPHNLVAACIVMFLAGLPFSAGPLLLKAMMADIADRVRLETGIDRSGLLFSLLTGSIKIGSAIAVGAGASILAASGFEAAKAGANSETALMTLSILFAVVPCAFAAAAALLLPGYRLDSAEHDRIREALAVRDRELAATPVRNDVPSALGDAVPDTPTPTQP